MIDPIMSSISHNEIKNVLGCRITLLVSLLRCLQKAYLYLHGLWTLVDSSDDTSWAFTCSGNGPPFLVSATRLTINYIA